jgi:hypothetical protein
MFPAALCVLRFLCGLESLVHIARVVTLNEDENGTLIHTNPH